MNQIHLLVNTLALLLIFISSQAQDFYVVTEKPASKYAVHKWNQSTNDLSFKFEFPFAAECNDIAISPSGEFYAVNVLGGIFKLDSALGTVNIVGQFPVINRYFSLVCSNNSILYSVDQYGDLVMYDLIVDTNGVIANVSPHIPSGDLTFYKGNLIYQSRFDGNIKAYNFTNDSIVNIFCVPPPIDDPISNGIWSNSNIFADCESEVIVGVSTNGGFYEFDFVNHTIQNLQVDTTNVAPAFLGSATTTEHLGSLCPSVQLNDVDCATVSIDESQLKSEIRIYPNPVTDRMRIVTDLPIDKVEIFDINGKLVQCIHYPKEEIYVDALLTGIYLLKISTPVNVLMKRIVK